MTLRDVPTLLAAVPSEAWAAAGVIVSALIAAWVSRRGNTEKTDEDRESRAAQERAEFLTSSIGEATALRAEVRAASSRLDIVNEKLLECMEAKAEVAAKLVVIERQLNEALRRIAELEACEALQGGRRAR